ncbi:MAG: PAS domain S-box protein [Syntrophaceae bacterium]|nr:PAS domain S-box protein [Syntrophaceae bacterium]
MHRLLKRQIKRFFGESFRVPEEWTGFIDLVNRAYHESDMDRGMLERSLELSSQELLQANSEMRAIFEAVPDLFFRVDASGKILDCKAGSHTPDLFISRSTMIGRRIDDIPVDSVARLFRRTIKDIRKTKKPVSIEYSLKRGGLEYFYEARWIPVEEDQTVIVIRNITDRKDAVATLKRSEEYYRELTEHSSDILYIVDQQGFIRYASPSVERFTGYPPEDLVGKSALFLIAPEDHARAIDDFRRALKITDAPVPNTFRIRHKNGSEIIMEGVGKNLLHHPVIAGFVMNVRDVTERRRAEEALRESENKYRLLTEKMTDIVWISDMNLKTVYVTPSVYTVLGFTQEERMLQTIDRQFTPESLSAGMEALARELELEKQGNADPHRTATLVLEYYHKDGSTRWLETVMSGLRNEEGKLIGLHGVSRDVTQQKQSQEALQRSEQKYRQLAETAHDLIITVDLDFKITYANKAIFHYTENIDVVGRSLLDFTPPHLHSVQKAMMQKRREGFDEMLAFEWEIVPPGGTASTFDIRASLITEEDRPTGVLFIARDITERKKAQNALRASEERYRAIFESTATANLIVNEDTTIVMANNNFVRLSGYTKKELEGKQSWTVFVHPENLERMMSYHRKRRMFPGSAPSSYEFRFVNRVGDIKELFISVAMIPETRDSILSLVDLTERKQLETQLLQAQKMEAVGRLAGGVAHDFNNMLSVIIGNTEMAMRTVSRSEPVYRLLQDVFSAGIRSADLTRQLLAFARRQTVIPKVLDLNDTISGTLKMLQRLIGENIDLGWHPGHKLWKVKIDPSQVDQILANLTVNARDAVGKTGKIKIETSNMICDESFCADLPESIPGEYVMLAVSDDGCGMNKEILLKIFEPFFTTKKEGQGTGLGLATVYGIVKQNGGFVNVESEPGQGTIFRIYLPRHGDKRNDTHEDEEEPEVQGGTETVLIVEDEEPVLKLSQAMLEVLGYTVLAANGKDQALEIARNYPEKIHLLLTDVVMPDMNGKELADRIQKVKPELKCLYMSGYTSDIIARQGILEEGVKFISKPFSVQDLATKIREVLG